MNESLGEIKAAEGQWVDDLTVTQDMNHIGVLVVEHYLPELQKKSNNPLLYVRFVDDHIEIGHARIQCDL